jgi:hypothetical protein
LNTPPATVTSPAHTRGRRTAYSSTENGTSLSLLSAQNQEKDTCAVNEASDDRARLRAVADELRAAGIPNADKLLRIGAAEMAQRSLASWRARGAANLGELAQMLMQGGPSPADTGYVSQRQRVIADMNAWRRGYQEGRP